MKKIFLSLTMFSAVGMYSQAPLAVCDLDGVNDGMTTVDISLESGEIIAASGQPLTSLVYYYITAVDAANSFNAIPNPTAYTTGTTILYAKAGNSPTVYSFNVQVNVVPLVDQLPDTGVCDYFVLPTITVGNYFSGPEGSGTSLVAGDILTYTTTVYIFASTGGGMCSDESSFTVTISHTPVIAPVLNVVACDAYVFPALAVGNYFSGPEGSGALITAGTVLTSTQTVYIYASTPFNCTAEQTFTVTINPSPTPQLQNGTICTDWVTGNLISGYTLETGFDASMYSFQWSMNGVMLTGATGSSYYATFPGTYEVAVTNLATGCSGSAPAYVAQSGPPIIENLSIVDQNLSFNVAGYGNYGYIIDGGAPIQIISNTPVYYFDLLLGTHVIEVFDQQGCGSTIFTIEIITPNPPLAPETQTFTPGQTVADLIAVGQNVLWYANAAATGRMTDTPLPLSTYLVDGTTYYASQTIDGNESTQRTPVTVTLSLGINSNAFAHFTFHPNPVKSILNLSNASDIKEVKVFNVLGQLVIKQEVNNTISQVDLSKVGAGIYMVKVSSENLEKTFRIIKE